MSAIVQYNKISTRWHWLCPCFVHLVELAVVAAPDLAVDESPVVLVIIELQLDADTHVNQAPGYGLHC